MDNADMGRFIKLQVFVDQALGIPPSHKTFKAPAGEVTMPTFEAGREAAGFVWMAVRDTEQYRAVAQRLRRTEGYSMVDFLLRESAGEKIETLSLRYGVSPGHFRRLFRKAIGRTPKAELKEWQLARAVLAFIDGKQSITDIASGHGYSSPSHFSNEARKALGISLTQLLGT